MRNNIKELINKELAGNDQIAANQLVKYLQKSNFVIYRDECDHCGSCDGGKTKVIFGKKFDAVCGCTFRVDNPQISDLPLVEYMIEVMVRQINES